ncbi:MAG: anion permease [Tissierellia bacterium]|nr:anion permease [Tissierellia bacterium]
MITAVLGALGALTAWFGVVFAKDLVEHKDNLEKETNFVTSGIIGFVVNFFDTLGIGSFAPATALLRGFKQIQDRIIPGTLNVSCTIPVVTEAFIFITAIEVETITLVSMLLAATLGAYLGAGIISKLPERSIQLVMGVALLVAAVIFFAQQMEWMPGGGDAIGLSGIKLIIGIVGNFILGALMTAGIGLYAPNMVLVSLLGMSPATAFPIMMGSCAFLMPVASVKFIREGAYNRKASLAITVLGFVSVFVAAYLVTSMPLYWLKWLVTVVVTYTGITLLYAASKSKNVPAKPEDI